jgi:hypothetical protein
MRGLERWSRITVREPEAADRSSPERSLGTKSPRRARHPQDESGAVLILALVFMVIVAGVVSALLEWSGNNLRNVAQFKSGRSMQYALNGATEIAMQSVRYQFTPTTSNPMNPPICVGTVPVTIDGNQVEVWCSTAWVPTSSQTRRITFSACKSATTVNGVLTPVSPMPTGASCAASPDLQAYVTFDDYSSSNSISDPTPCTATCGTSQTVYTWVLRSEGQ